MVDLPIDPDGPNENSKRDLCPAEVNNTRVVCRAAQTGDERLFFPLEIPLEKRLRLLEKSSLLHPKFVLE